MTTAHADLLATFRAARQGEMTVDEALAVLRREGANAIDSLKVLCEAEGLRLGEAKHVLDASHAWRDQRDANEALRDAAERALSGDTNAVG